MNTEPIRLFLTADNIRYHIDYYKLLKAKFSIYQKSIPELNDTNFKEIKNMGLNRQLAAEIRELFAEMKSHEIYFSSFTTQQTVNASILKHYSSKEAFLYDVLCCSVNSKSNFVYVGMFKNKPVITDNAIESFDLYDVKLAVDISEHAYFLDYRFDRERYIKNALTHLNLIKLDIK